MLHIYVYIYMLYIYICIIYIYICIIYIYMYITLFFRFYSYIDHYRVLTRVPMLYSKFPSVIHFLYSSVHIKSQSPNLSFPLPP